MLYQRCLRAAALGCGLAIAASTAHAVPLDCTGTMSPTGSPIALSASKHYFIYKNVPTTLLGQTYEYICHIDQSLLAGRDSTYCTLNTYKDVFTTMQSNKNNVIRQEAIFDHSPGWMSKCNECGLTPCNGPTHTCCGDVFPHEQPFVFSGGKWNLTLLDSTYFDNLENVVCDAYKKDIIVEVSLLNVWDGKFVTSPFNPNNAINGMGFTAQQYFMSFDTNAGNYAAASDTQGTNPGARAAQRLALTEVVNRLKKYPNVIWEVANEPDLVPSQFDGIVNKEQVLVWQERMIDAIVAVDTTHLIEMEGHTDTTFAWLETKSRANVESAHYVDIVKSVPAGNYFGAMKVLQSNYTTVPKVPIDPKLMPLGFNENKAVPNSPAVGTCAAGLTRTENDGRPEAWEFMMNGGGLFNGYSFDRRTTGPAPIFSAQLSHLRDVLYPQGNVGTLFVDDMRQATCKASLADAGNPTTDWCAGISYSVSDNGTCSPQGALIFGSSIQSSQNTFYGWGYEDHALYLHHAKVAGGDFLFYQGVRCGDGSNLNGYHTPGISYLVHQDGCFLESWIDPATGVVKVQNPISLVAMCGSPKVACWTPAKAAPYYAQDVLLFLQRVGNGPNCGTGGAGDPTAVISYSCNYLYCNFDGSASTATYQITSYSWNWGDGTTSASGSPRVVHNFATPGSYTVTLTITDALPESGSSSQAVPVAAQPPTSSFYAVCNLTACTFYSGNSKPGSAAIHSYSWTFGDGATDVVPFPSHTYAAGGSYAVTLIVTDDFNVSASSTVTVAVTGPPAARIAFSCSGLVCNFDASSSTPGSSPISTYGWTFGDGAGGSGVTVSHTYAASGTYTVTLTATDTQGQAGTQSQQVTVTAPVPPAASFIFTCSLLTCSFDGTGSTAGSYPIASYSWSFGDAASGAGATINHGFAAKGTYTVTLTVTDSTQRQGTYSKVLTVTSDPPPAVESYFALPPCRVLDTRNPPNTVLVNGQSQTFQVAGKCGIPSTAKAVSLTVTVAGPTGAGALDLYPGDQTPVFSTLYFDPSRSPRATNTVVQLAINGAGTVVVLPSVAGSPGQVHLILDVDGYFSQDTAPAPGAQGPLGYQTITPCRIVDTRTTNTPLVAGTVSNFTIQGSCGIPAGAVTAALNAAIVAPSNSGFITLYPSSLPATPTDSNMNWVAGTSAIANGERPILAATTPDLTARFSSVAGNTAHLILDTMGYFKSGAPYKYYPVTQCRAVHTGVAGWGAPSLAAGTTRSFQIQGNCGVPVGAKAAFISTIVLAGNTTTGGLLLLFPSGGSPNGTSFMNWDTAEPAMSGGAIVQLSSSNADISFATSSTVDLIVKVFGYFQ